jgi:hypothetical protein
MAFPNYSLVAGDGTIVAFVFVDAGNSNLPFSLTGLTASLAYKVGNGPVQTKVMTNDPDQVTNKGKATYQFQPTDLTPGMMEVAGYVTDGGGNRVSQLVPFIWEVRPSPLV